MNEIKAIQGFLTAYQQTPALELLRETTGPERDIEEAIYGTIEVDECGIVWWIEGEDLGEDLDEPW